MTEVRTAPVERRAAVHDLRLVGKVSFDETRLKTISARVPGRLDRLYVDYTGVRVKKGEHLVWLYSPELLEGQEELLQAKAQVESAKLNLSYTTITSPMTGVSSSARQTDGTYISPQNSLLTTVAVLSPIWVNFSISENEMYKYRDQMAKGLLRSPNYKDFEVEIILVDGSVYPYAGKMTFAEPSYNRQTGTFLIRATVHNPEGVLRPNQYVRARLKGSVRPNAILVPQRAVQQGARGHFVWVVGDDNKVEQRPVTVGGWHEDDWFIFEGLRSGDKAARDHARSRATP